MEFKKTLMLSSAISAVALLSAQSASAAEAPKLKIGGYIETVAGVADTDKNSSKRTNGGTPTYGSGVTHDGEATLLQYGEINFSATGATDSGMKWKAYVELASDDSGNKNGADEVSLTLSGSWGSLDIGGQDGAADKMQTGHTSVDMLGGNTLGAIVYDRNQKGNKARMGDQTNVMENSDNSKLTYYTPRISGFQAGVSWYPRLSARGTLGDNESGAKGDSSSGFELGLSHRGSLAGGKYEVALVATHAAGDEVNSGAAAADGNRGEGRGIGVEYEHGAWMMGASYALNKNWRVNYTTQESWGVGVGYKLGNGQIAAYYLDQSDDRGSADAQNKLYNIQYGYNFGGGLTGAVGYYDGSQKNSTGGTSNNDFQLLLAKLVAKF